MDKKGYGDKEEIQEVAEKIWEQLRFMGKYGFPKAHSTSYSLIANATQFLKVHYPVEFFCSLLRQSTDDEYAMISSVSKKKYDVRYIMPEINMSKDIFTIRNGKIVWSLTSLKGIGIKAADEIVDKQPFDTFEDFFERVNKRVVNVRVVRVLISAKVYRKFGNRNEVNELYHKLRKDKDFVKKTKEEWDSEAMLVMPFVKRSIRKAFPKKTRMAMTHDEFLDKYDNERVVVAGFVSDYRYVNSKRGKMIIIKVTDESDTFNVVCWNEMYEKLHKKGISVKKDMPLRISGRKGKSHIGEDQIALGNDPDCYVKVLNK